MEYINNEIFLMYCDIFKNKDSLSEYDKQILQDICTTIENANSILDQAIINGIINKYVDVKFDEKTNTCTISLDNMPKNVKKNIHKNAEDFSKTTDEEFSR